MQFEAGWGPDSRAVGVLPEVEVVNVVPGEVVCRGDNVVEVL